MMAFQKDIKDILLDITLGFKKTSFSGSLQIIVIARAILKKQI